MSVLRLGWLVVGVDVLVLWSCVVFYFGSYMFLNESYYYCFGEYSVLY